MPGAVSPRRALGAARRRVRGVVFGLVKEAVPETGAVGVARSAHLDVVAVAVGHVIFEGRTAAYAKRR